jgi:hypothetical protein
MPADRRRFYPIETRFRQHGQVAHYDLTIDGELWSCVEWSPTRRAWCIQDASGECLAHVEAIHGQDVDADTAVRLAKRMILDGRMPTPEQAYNALTARTERQARQQRQRWARIDAEMEPQPGNAQRHSHPDVVDPGPADNDLLMPDLIGRPKDKVRR